MFRIGVGLCCCIALSATLTAAETESPVGRVIDEFSLKDYRGKSHTLASFGDHKILVIAFLGTECPLAKLYAPRLASLADKYSSRGVGFVGINANRQDSITEIAAYARIHQIKFPLLKDLGNRVADQLGAVRTPEVYVLDENRVVRYWGRIDDQYQVGIIRDKPTKHELANAIERLLDGQSPEVSETKAVGCFIGRVRQPSADSQVTYSNQVSRILQKRCVECHCQGDIAPFALVGFDEVAGWADTIAEVIRDERMPPWHADPAHGEFKNNRRMTIAEKDLIYRWVADGAPEGNAEDLPAPLHYVEGWQLPRQPDVVIPISDEPYEVPAEGEVKYQYFTVDPGFTEDKWLKTAQLLPGNRAVVHHILVFLKQPGAKRASGRRGFLVGYVPGMRPMSFPEGMAKHIPAGSQFVFQVHYTPVGSVQHDSSKLGLVFADPEELTHAVKTTSAIQGRFRIPPHADNHRVEASSSKYDRDVQLLGMMPHMHLRGKAFRYEAVFPDGKRETLLDVPRYDFNWQTSYRLAEPKLLPAGTRLHCVAHFDNSENNLANPDPSATVRWGDQTWDEMMIGYFDVAMVLDDNLADGTSIPDLKPNRTSQAKEFLKRFDKNDDGQITEKEVPRRARRYFKLLDKNKNGKLSADELVKLVELRGE